VIYFPRLKIDIKKESDVSSVLTLLYRASSSLKYFFREEMVCRIILRKIKYVSFFKKKENSSGFNIKTKKGVVKGYKKTLPDK